MRDAAGALVPAAARANINAAIVAAAATVAWLVLVGVSAPRVKVCRKSEAWLELNKLARLAKLYYARHGTFPTGQSAMLPPWTCCPEKCAALPAQAWAMDPVW